MTHVNPIHSTGVTITLDIVYMYMYMCGFVPSLIVIVSTVWTYITIATVLMQLNSACFLSSGTDCGGQSANNNDDNVVDCSNSGGGD